MKSGTFLLYVKPFTAHLEALYTPVPGAVTTAKTPDAPFLQLQSMPAGS